MIHKLDFEFQDQMYELTVEKTKEGGDCENEPSNYFELLSMKIEGFEVDCNSEAYKAAEVYTHDLIFDYDL